MCSIMVCVTLWINITTHGERAGPPMDRHERLHLALVASTFGKPRTLAARLRREGTSALTQIESGFDPATRVSVADEAHNLWSEGIDATLLSIESYPQRLARLSFAPPVLYLKGPVGLLHQRSIGMCGSRHASSEGLKAASSCGAEVSSQGLVVVSGYARGVDMATHIAALQANGETIIVLAEGICRFSVKRGEFADSYDEGRTLVLSQFPPRQPWSAGAAMTRNGVILGLSLGLVVVEAGATGGTLAAGKQALEVGRHVYALSLGATPVGNTELITLGATPVGSRGELAEYLVGLRNNGAGPAQLSLI